MSPRMSHLATFVRRARSFFGPRDDPRYPAAAAPWANTGLSGAPGTDEDEDAPMRMWELRRVGGISEPIPEDEVEAMLEAGTIEGALPVRPVGKDAWKPAFRHAPFAAAASRAQKQPGSTLLSTGGSSAPPPKDPARWDQMTQLNMPVPLGARAPVAPPPLPQSPSHAPAPVVTVVTAPRLPPAPPPNKSFLSGLFDFSFATFVTTRVVKSLYMLFVFVVGLAALGGVAAGVAGVQAGRATGSDLALALVLLQIAATPLVALLVITLGRIACESLVVFFRVAEHLAEINRKTVG